ncbi:MAG: site-specific integrase, partial [Proteobacteria bacterium]|nr:site-specific integrase [Pseudomonadota bacterium]
VEKIIREGGSRIVTDDSGRKGQGKLALRVRDQFAEWFYVYYFEGRRRMVKLGAANGAQGLSLDEAEDGLKAYREQVMAGLDPKVELERKTREKEAAIRKAASRGTVEQLFSEYVDDMQRRGKSSWKQVERALLTGEYAAARTLGRDTKAADVIAPDIRDVLREVYTRGSTAMAYHLRAYLFGAFRYGLGHEHDYTRGQQGVSFGLQGNPAAAVPVDKEARNPGARVLTDEEIRAVWFDLPRYGATARPHLALQLILATGGQRVRECCMARVEEFDLDARIWTIPESRTKNHRAHALPLTERAAGIVQAALDECGGSEFLYPGARSNEKPLTSEAINRVVSRFCERAGVTRWSPRDLRRTCRTRLADAGEPDYRIDRLLNHGTSTGVGQKHYDRSQHLSDKSKALARWDGLLAAILGEKQAKLLSLHQANNQ